jgi:hypothetical protein
VLFFFFFFLREASGSRWCGILYKNQKNAGNVLFCSRFLGSGVGPGEWGGSSDEENMYLFPVSLWLSVIARGGPADTIDALLRRCLDVTKLDPTLFKIILGPEVFGQGLTYPSTYKYLNSYNRQLLAITATAIDLGDY